MDHYQIQRVVDVYVTPAGEDLGRVASAITTIVGRTTRLPNGVRVNLRGMVQAMQSSFTSFGFGLILAVVLLYLVLVAPFRSFLDPLLILLAVPARADRRLARAAPLRGTTLNVMSLMGLVMLVGIVVSNSILIVEFTQRLREDRRAAARGGRRRLPRAAAPGADDVAGDGDRPVADGAEARHGQRGLSRRWRAPSSAA